VRADNVRSAMMFVARGESPLGIVYATDALADSQVRIVDTFPENTHAPITYPGATIRGAAPKPLPISITSPARGARHLAAFRIRELKK
jgi:molybdate transport system substrate-binding protein